MFPSLTDPLRGPGTRPATSRTVTSPTEQGNGMVRRGMISNVTITAKQWEGTSTPERGNVCSNGLTSTTTTKCLGSSREFPPQREAEGRNPPPREGRTPPLHLPLHPTTHHPSHSLPPSITHSTQGGDLGEGVG